MSTESVLVEGLTKEFHKVTAVKDVSLAVRQGEFLGFLGPNGAGKTTTIRLLCGLLRPTRGKIRVAGIDVVRQPVEVKARIGILPDEIDTFDRLTGLELLVFSGRMHALSPAEAERRALDLLELVGIEKGDRGRLVIDYSMGMKKKVALAAALIHGPEVIFLDEPFNGVDVVSVRAIRDVLQELARRGVTIFFSSHVMEVVEKLCTSIAIIDKGSLKACGPLDAVRATLELPADASVESIFLKAVGHAPREVELEWLRGTGAASPAAASDAEGAK
jgi:ABC-2 type transport system ATP-binding protein